MIFKPSARGKPKCKTFTLMLIPGKYGSLKTLNIPRFLIQFFVIFNMIGLILIGVFVLNYKNLKSSYDYYLRHSQELKAVNESQHNEITELKKSADEIKSKLLELKELEGELRERLNISSSLSRGGTSVQKSYTYSGADGNRIEDIDMQISSINKLLQTADNKISYIKSKPSVLPAQGRISCYFGERSNPFSGRGVEFHSGVDIANSKGTVIKAAGDGTVQYSGWKDGYGNTIFISHKGGYISIYGHCSELLVSEGEKVKKGQTIALMGSTGRSTGNHVHFEIRINDEAVDPFKVINGGI